MLKKIMTYKLSLYVSQRLRETCLRGTLGSEHARIFSFTAAAACPSSTRPHAKRTQHTQHTQKESCTLLTPARETAKNTVEKTRRGIFALDPVTFRAVAGTT